MDCTYTVRYAFNNVLNWIDLYNPYGLYKSMLNCFTELTAYVGCVSTFNSTEKAVYADVNTFTKDDCPSYCFSHGKCS